MKLIKSDVINSNSILTIKITLLDSSPIIWRRIMIPAKLSFYKLHQLIQLSMGWTDSHLHEFNIENETYVDLEVDVDYELHNEEPPQDVRKVKLHQVVKLYSKFLYYYDFGDGWKHELAVEAVNAPENQYHYPLCIDGANACPPEDCGGIGGFYRMLKIIKNKKDEEYEEMLTWLGGQYDPTSFDANRINRDLIWRKRW